MKIGMTVGVGGMQFHRFDSSEHDTVQECAKDLIAQMQPLSLAYPSLVQRIAEIKTAYGV